MLRLHNSLSRQIEPFVPQNPNAVTMYVCGPTVYDTPHLGNARPAVVFDVLFRVLRHLYPEVLYARNLTDIDDKIIDRAKENGEEIGTLTERTIREYHDVAEALGCLPPTYEPRATGNITPMKGMIAQLLLEGHAYESQGHVLFDVSSHAGHGKLSRHLQENLDAGHRVATASYKRNPGDFVLWKPSAPDQPGWDSLWGRGRPGWHIECSAMIDSIFASQTIDIHGGGGDLRFPHHDCEISQSECANHRPLANFWLHNGMLLINGEKMSKSAGNFTTVRDVLARYEGQVIRLALLSAHYRSPLNWTEQVLEQAKLTLSRWHLALIDYDVPPGHNEVSQDILEALGNDLNVPLAVSRLHKAMSDLGEYTRPRSRPQVVQGIRYAAKILGLDLVHNSAFLRGDRDTTAIEALMSERQQARDRKNWAESDRLRNLLLETHGVIVEDFKDRSTWRKAG